MAVTNLGKIVITNKGDYVNATSYDILDVVSYGGSSYLAKTSVPVGILPSNTAYWQLLAQKGDTGAGVSVGGTAGQVLKKVDGTDYNTGWVDEIVVAAISNSFITNLI